MTTGYRGASVQARSRGGGGLPAGAAGRHFREAWALTLMPCADPPPCPSPQDLRRKAARLVAAKCTLAARVDSFHESTEGKVRVASVSARPVCGLSVVHRGAQSSGDPPARGLTARGGSRAPSRAASPPPHCHDGGLKCSGPKGHGVAVLESCRSEAHGGPPS